MPVLRSWQRAHIYVLAAWVFAAREPGSGTSFALSLIRTNRRRVTRIFILYRNKEKEAAHETREEPRPSSRLHVPSLQRHRPVLRALPARLVTSRRSIGINIGRKYKCLQLIILSRGDAHVCKISLTLNALSFYLNTLINSLSLSKYDSWNFWVVNNLLCTHFSKIMILMYKVNNTMSYLSIILKSSFKYSLSKYIYIVLKLFPAFK